MSANAKREAPSAWIIRYPDGVVISVIGESIPKAYEKYAQPLFAESNVAELAAANQRIAKLESLAAEHDAMLGRRPCQNSRCLELNAARALLREVTEGSTAFSSALECNYDFDGFKWAEKVRSYLDACDTLEGK